MDYTSTGDESKYRLERANSKRRVSQVLIGLLILLLLWNYSMTRRVPKDMVLESQSIPDMELEEGAVVEDVDAEILKPGKEREIVIKREMDDDDGAFLITSEEEELRQKRNKIRKSFKHAWNGYQECCFGHDEILPLSNESKDSWGGFGLTVLDSMDTLLLMDLDEEFVMARDFVVMIDFDKDYNCSFLETTVHHLGALLSVFSLTKDRIFLQKAVDLADRLVYAFDPQSKVPHSNLEFRYLSLVSENTSYSELADYVDNVLASVPGRTKCGLPPLYFDTKATRFVGGKTLYITAQELIRIYCADYASVGALGDSYYEYLFKNYLITGQNVRFMRRYNIEVDLVLQNLLITKGSMNFISDWEKERPNHRMDHLSCFLPGLLALDSMIQDGETKERNLRLARLLCDTCYKLYTDSKTGLGPEVISSNTEGGKGYEVTDPSYHLRPETIESIFYLWRATHDEKYRKWGWELYEMIEKHAKTPSAYSGIEDVNADIVRHDNSLPTFFFSGTLKYLYLLFCDDEVLPLDKYVFNTEGIYS